MYCPFNYSYTIQEGDNLYKISTYYHTTVQMILAQNPGLNPYNLKVGSTIKVCPGSDYLMPGCSESKNCPPISQTASATERQIHSAPVIRSAETEAGSNLPEERSDQSVAMAENTGFAGNQDMPGNPQMLWNQDMPGNPGIPEGMRMPQNRTILDYNMIPQNIYESSTNWSALSQNTQTLPPNRGIPQNTTPSRNWAGNSQCMQICPVSQSDMQSNIPMSSGNPTPMPQNMQTAPPIRNPIPEGMQTAPINQNSMAQNMQAALINRSSMPQGMQTAPMNRNPMPQSMQAAPMNQNPVPQSMQAVPMNQNPMAQGMQAAPMHQSLMPQNMQYVSMERNMELQNVEVCPSDHNAQPRKVQTPVMDHIAQSNQSTLMNVFNEKNWVSAMELSGQSVEEAPVKINEKYLKLNNSMRNAWSEYVHGIRMLMLSTVETLGDRDAVAGTVLESPRAVAVICAVYYPKESADRVEDLLTDMVRTGAAVFKAHKDKNKEKSEGYGEQWFDHADRLAEQLSSMNPNVELETVRKRIYAILQLLKQSAKMRLEKEYKEDILAYDSAKQESMEMADYLVNAIAKQFPDKF